MFQLVIVALLTIALVNYFIKSQYGRFKRSFPGPSPLQKLPFLGHSYLLKDEPVKTIFKMKDKYGSIFRLDVGSLPTVFLTDNDVITKGIKSGGITSRPFKLIPTYVKYCRPQTSKGMDVHRIACSSLNSVTLSQVR